MTEGFDVKKFVESFPVLAAADGGVIKLRTMVLGLGLRGTLGSGGGGSQGPGAWRQAAVADVADCVLGKMLDRTKHTKGTRRPYLRNINVRWGSCDLSDLLEMFFEDDELDRYGVRPGDVLICEGGEPGRASVWRSKAPILIQKAIHRVRPGRDLHPEWLVLNLRYDTWSGHLDGHFTGATIKHFTGQALRRYTIPLPPLAEQKRIVAGVDQLMGLIDELEATQTKKREMQTRFRTSALDALTRAEGPEELASAWKRVAGNFEVLFERGGSVGDLRNVILTLAAEGRLVRPKTPVTPILPSGGSYDPDFVVPRHWAWSPLGQLCKFIDYRGRTPVKTEKGVPLITAKNVRMGYLRQEPREFIADADYESWMTRGLPRYGDVLFTTEAPLGNVAQLLTSEKVALAQRVITLRPVDAVEPAFLQTMLMSPPMQAAIRKQATGTTAMGIKAAKLKLIPFAAPGKVEQGEIVAKVEALMMLCDDLEARLCAKEETASKLVEAVVKELVV